MEEKIEITEKTPKVLIAVYGTLRMGEGNHRLLEGRAKYLGTFKTLPKFTMYGKNSGFPIVTPSGKTPITYELFEVSDNNTLSRLHSLEGFSGFMNHPKNWYDVTPIDTPHGQAYMYIQDREFEGTQSIITTGDWKKR